MSFSELGTTFKCKGQCTLPECCSLSRSSKENPHDACMTALLTACVTACLFHRRTVT